jgi:hypothetical protein
VIHITVVGVRGLALVVVTLHVMLLMLLPATAWPCLVKQQVPAMQRKRAQRSTQERRHLMFM